MWSNKKYFNFNIVFLNSLNKRVFLYFLMNFIFFCLYEFIEFFVILLPIIGVVINLYSGFLFIISDIVVLKNYLSVNLFLSKQWEWFNFCLFLIIKYFYIFYDFFSFNFEMLENLIKNIIFGKNREIYNCSLFGKNFSILLFNGFNIFYISSLDVIHSLGISCLGFKLDGVPGFFSGGMIEIFYGYRLKEGVFKFSCYEL